jgi:NADH-quinone oxidoreductase subunit N
MTPERLIADLALALPELVLALGAMAALLVGAWTGDRRGFGLVTALCVALLVAAGVIAASQAGLPSAIGFSGSIVRDGFASYAKAVIAFSAAGALLLSIDYMKLKRLERPEYPVLATLAVLGMFIMASANDLIALYIGIEMQSLCLYVLAAYARDDAKSSEAGLKYFVLGALSSGLLLYGASLVYGFAGSVNFQVIAQATEASNIGLVFGLVFVICGLAFKVSAAPFHMWTPDVYEGAPTPATAFFAAAPKVAAMVLLARTLFEGFGTAMEQWQPIIIILAIASMAVGSLGALRQRNIKRLMAYSSIANMGYALVAVAAGPAAGPQALLVFLTIYAATSVGVFGAILAMRRESGFVETIDDLAGLSRTKPWLAVALTALLFSVAGVPPLAGFLGKLQLFIAAADADLAWLLVVMSIASVVSAFYYLRIVKIMWFDEPAPAFAPAGTTLAATISAAALLAFPVLVVAIAALEPLARQAGAAFK